MLDVLWPQMKEGLKERWEWSTDVLTANDGSEERTATRSHPLKAFTVTFQYRDTAKANFIRAIAFKQAGVEIKLPMMQRAVRINEPLAETIIAFDNEYCDVRNGDEVLIFDVDSVEVGTVVGVSAAGCTLSTGLTADRSYAWLCPVRALVPRNVLTMKRVSVDAVGEATILLEEASAVDPVKSPYNADTFATFSSKLVIGDRPVGKAFDERVLSGAQVTELANHLDVRSDWLRSKIAFPFTWRLDRTADAVGKWIDLLDDVKGSESLFYVPSWRADFNLYTNPTAGGTTFVCEDDIYSETYEGHIPTIFIETEAGIHYATVSNVTTGTGRDTITFTPALPGGAGWGTITKVGFLYRVRISDDAAEFVHYDQESFLTLNLVTATA